MKRQKTFILLVQVCEWGKRKNWFPKPSNRTSRTLHQRSRYVPKCMFREMLNYMYTSSHDARAVFSCLVLAGNQHLEWEIRKFTATYVRTGRDRQKIWPTKWRPSWDDEECTRSQWSRVPAVYGRSRSKALIKRTLQISFPWRVRQTDASCYIRIVIHGWYLQTRGRQPAARVPRQAVSIGA